jgi:hypothetical protein
VTSYCLSVANLQAPAATVSQPTHEGIAASAPDQKELLIRLVIKILQEDI